MKEELLKISPQNLTELTAKTDNIYKSVTIIAKRANQVSSKMKAELMEKLSDFAPSGDSMEEISENREQIEISKFYEGLSKPTLIALREFLDNKIEVTEL
ncbi:MAG: DNA-directed RNA polymerase subunit omega [Bacteroidia bacterium]|nr:DNA-directed RNA polymerase subunit omega [Bacteroidia bacterium]